MIINKISKNLQNLDSKYENWDLGGCRYVALYIYQNLKKLKIFSQLKIFSYYDRQQEIPYNLNLKNRRLLNRIAIFHIVNKIDSDLFLDLKGTRSSNELYRKYGSDISEIDEYSLEWILKNPRMWNTVFNRKSVFRIKRDINLIFEKIITALQKEKQL